MAQRILITGRPGVGKTTLVKNTLALLSPIAGGFLTREIRRQGQRVGFLVMDIHTGREGILAHRDHKGGPRVGKYGVDVPAFERVGVRALHEALDRKGCIVIDEIGKMELYSMVFADVVTEVLDSRHPVLATIPVHRHPFLDALRRRSDVRLLEVAAANRDRLPEQIAVLLGSADGPERHERLP